MDRNRYWNLLDDATTPRDLLQRFAHGAKVLEVGCGTGLESRALAGDGFEVTAIDVDADAIKLARHSLNGSASLHFEALDFSEHRFQEEFDVVYERGVLHNVKSNEDRAHFVEQVALALRPNGVWINITGCADDRRHDRQHGCLFLSHLIPPVEELFEILFVERRPYGMIEAGFEFDAWYCVFRRRADQ